MYRIFVVEDDAVIASAVQRHLESWGYQVACAVRFDDVLSDFAAFDPQLVLLDISLPFFNGYPLVPGNPKGVQGPHSVPHLRLRRHEPGDGHGDGRG